MNTESPPEGSGYTGKDILYREGATGFFDVQRAADALLREGRKPSVAGIREQLGGGSPNTITPLLAKYWQKLGERLAEGPESLERVPEALARVTELLWRRALEEAKERLIVLQAHGHLEETGNSQEQVHNLTSALAEAQVRGDEQLVHLTALIRERVALRNDLRAALSLAKGTQSLLAAERARADALQIRMRAEWGRSKRQGASASSKRVGKAKPASRRSAKRRRRHQ